MQAKKTILQGAIHILRNQFWTLYMTFRFRPNKIILMLNFLFYLCISFLCSQISLFQVNHFSYFTFDILLDINEQF